MTIPFIAARWHGGSQTPKVVVIHGTVSPCAAGGARATANFFAREGNKTSAHYVVDPGAVVQCVPDHKVAFHCGHNQDSIGVELCDPQAGTGKRWADKNHEAMLARAADLVAGLCTEFGIPIARLSVADLRAGKHGICGHVDETNAFHASTHTDPGPDFPWGHFIDLVRTAANARKEPKMNAVQSFREGVLALAKAHPIPKDRSAAHDAQAAIVARAEGMPES